ncbi:MAG: hypothetical protein MUO51_09445 [Woeseiaceae bacterium]|nr:hypothetical protein [Woeseiaceae bacterium]
MKLTDRELEIFLNYSKVQKGRRIGAWLGLVVTFCAYILVSYFDFHHDSLALIFGIFLGISIVELTTQYFRVRPEDKLINLLQRFINTDPEALGQVLERPGTDEAAA